MARFKPRQDLIDLKNQFSQKNSVNEFKKLHQKLYETMNNYPNEEKLKGGEYQTMITEISTLNCIIDKYKPSHIEYTGGTNSSKDAILYFNEQKQEVEIVGMVDEQEMESMKRTGIYSQITGVSLFEMMQNHALSEDCARKYLKSQLKFDNSQSIKQQLKENISMPQGQSDIPEDFLYKKIISVLKKKNQEKYKNFWLLISYFPGFLIDYFGNEKVRQYVLKKIQSEQDNLIDSLKQVFKKIIFIPFNEGQKNHRVFEWPL